MGVTVRRWTEPFPAATPADVVVDAFGGGLPEPYVEAMARAAEPTRVVHPRVPERGRLGGRRARTRLASSAACAAATLLVSRIHREDRRSSARARPPRLARCVPARRRGAARAVGGARRSPARAGRDPRLALLLSESGVAAAPRRVGRGRRHRRVRRARRRGDRRARRVDRGQRAASAPSVPSGSIDAACHSVRGAGHLRPVALVVVAQLRARRGFVRSRAVGGARVRLEHLSATARGALAEARRVPRALDGRTRSGTGGGAAALFAGLERRAGCGADRRRMAGLRRWRARCSTGMPRPGPRSSPSYPTWRRDWSRPPCIGYN